MATTDNCNNSNSGDADGVRPFSSLIRPDLAGYCGAFNLAFNEQIKARQKSGEVVYHFGFGQAPFPVMPAMKEALSEFAGVTEYLPVAGIPELRACICEFHKHYDNLCNLDPERVLVGPGSKELIYLLLSVFNGDVLVLSPCWTTYRPQTRLAGKKSYVIPLSFEGGWRVTAEAIEKTIQDNKLHGNKMLILCNPDTPTGVAYSEEHLRKISAACRKHNIVVVSDEIYGRLHYKQEHDTLARYYPEGTIISTGYSKWASVGGWRLGYHIYPRELKVLLDAVTSAASHTYSSAPAPMQYAVAKTLQNRDEVDTYIKHTNRIMATVGDFCYRELLAEGVKARQSEGGYYIFPDFGLVREALRKRGVTSGEEFCRLVLEEASVALMSGGPAFLRPLDEFTTRLCYVNFDGKAALEESMRVGLTQPLPDDFVPRQCEHVYGGIKSLRNWVRKQLE